MCAMLQTWVWGNSTPVDEGKKRLKTSRDKKCKARIVMERGEKSRLYM